MSRGFSNIVEVVMSLFVEAGGQSVSRGGGGMLMSLGRSIGWAGPARGSRGRIGGHRLGGHAMGAGFSGRGDLTNYNPKTAHLQMQSAEYSRGCRSGSGLVSAPRRQSRPAALFGRSVFEGADTLTGSPTNRWVRQGGYSSRGPGSYAPAPRSFIKFNR